jgi:hypothetical protein
LERSVRALDIALTTLALRAAPTRPQKGERRLVPAVDEPDAALLDRTAIPHQQAALIASLWPAPTRQCVAPPLFLELPAPAVFGVVFRVGWPSAPTADARVLQARLSRAFPGPGPEAPDPGALAA